MKNRKKKKERTETLLSIKLKEAIDKIAKDKLNNLSKKDEYFKRLKEIQDEKT